MTSLQSLGKHIIGCILENLDGHSLATAASLLNKPWKESSERLLKRLFDNEFNGRLITEPSKELKSFREKYLFNRMVQAAVTESWIKRKPIMHCRRFRFPPIVIHHLPDSRILFESPNYLYTACFPLSYDRNQNPKINSKKSECHTEPKCQTIDLCKIHQTFASNTFNNLVARIMDSGNVIVCHQETEKAEVQKWEYKIAGHGKIIYLTFTATGTLILFTDTNMFHYARPCREQELSNLKGLSR